MKYVISAYYTFNRNMYSSYKKHTKATAPGTAVNFGMFYYISIITKTELLSLSVAF